MGLTMMEQITAYLSQYGPVALLAVVGTGFVTSNYWLPAVKGLLNRRNPEPTEAERDIAEVAALRLLQERARRSGCQKFIDAVHAVEPCFFNKAEPAK